MEVIQSIYIFLLNSIYRVTGKIEQRIRNFIIWLFSFLLILLCIYNYAIPSRTADTSQFERDVMGCVFLAVIAVFSVDRVLEKVKWNRQFAIIWYSLAGVMFLSGCLHSVENSYWLWSVSMLVGFPGFYLIWQNRQDYQTLFYLVSVAMLVALSIYIVLSLLVIDSSMFSHGRYLGGMRNPNHLGKMAASGIIAVLYLSSQAKYGWCYGIMCGICLKLAILSGSRAAVIVIAAQFLVRLIFFIKPTKERKNNKKRILKSFIFLLFAYISFWGYGKGLEYYQNSHGAEKKIEQQTERQTEFSKSEIKQQTERQTEFLKSEIEADRTVQVSETKSEMEDIEENTEKLLENKFFLKGKTVDQFTSGRISIWRHFLKKMNLFGNDWKRYKSGTPEYTFQWAHNDIIEIAYRSGIVAGILEIAFLISLSIYMFRTLFFKERVEGYQSFIAYAILTYGGYAMMDVISFPFSMQYTFMFFISLMPLFDRKSELKISFMRNYFKNPSKIIGDSRKYESFSKKRCI